MNNLIPANVRRKERWFRNRSPKQWRRNRRHAVAAKRAAAHHIYTYITPCNPFRTKSNPWRKKLSNHVILAHQPTNQLKKKKRRKKGHDRDPFIALVVLSLSVCFFCFRVLAFALLYPVDGVWVADSLWSQADATSAGLGALLHFRFAPLLLTRRDTVE